MWLYKVVHLSPREASWDLDVYCNAFIVKNAALLRVFVCLYFCLWPLIVPSGTAEFQLPIFANIAAHTVKLSFGLYLKAAFFVPEDKTNRTFDYV